MAERQDATRARGVRNIRVHNGKIHGIDREGTRVVGYIITNKHTGEERFYWGAVTVMGSMGSPEEFGEEYEIDPDDYEVIFEFGEAA